LTAASVVLIIRMLIGTQLAMFGGCILFSIVI
jgi:hypothetical protein